MKVARKTKKRKTNVNKGLLKNENKFTTKQKIYAILTGVSCGVINGVFGGGGGMIVVPMLTYLLKYEEKYAHATAILIILPLSIVSSIFYISFGNLELGLLLPVGVGVVAGGTAGALLLSKLSSKWIGIIFSLVMAAAGIKMLFF